MSGHTEQRSAAMLGQGSAAEPAPSVEPGGVAANGAKPAEAAEPTVELSSNQSAVRTQPATSTEVAEAAEPTVELTGAQPTETTPPDGPASFDEPPRRTAGTVIANRYRLLAQAGADASVHAAFWRARDTVLERDVALTLLQETGEAGETERADKMIAKALRWGQFEHPGCARLLDVMPGDHDGLPEDVLGLAVTEWVPGQSLTETVATGPMRTATVLSMLDPLAQSTEAAHRQGLVLGCAHPQRIRITPEGEARLAFPLPPPEATPADDVRGLGAVLYALLTGHWPLSGTEAELAGLPPAPRDVQDMVVPPGIVRPGVSVEVSALAMGALGAGATHGRVHTAAGVHKVVTELLETEQEAALLPPPDDGAPVPRDEVWRVDSTPKRTSDPHRKRKLSIGLGGLGLGMLAVIAYVGVQLGSLLGVTPPSSPRIVVNNPSAAGSATAPGQGGANALPPASSSRGESVVLPASIRVFDPTGDPDNAGRISRAVDDDTRSSWSTYIYHQQFPALKPGVGVMVSFASPVQLSRMTITSPSQDSHIEIRSAPSPDATFGQTIPIGEMTLRRDSTTVSLTGSQPVQNVLVWINKLGGGGDQNVTEISDLRFERVTG